MDAGSACRADMRATSSEPPAGRQYDWKRPGRPSRCGVIGLISVKDDVLKLSRAKEHGEKPRTPSLEMPPELNERARPLAVERKPDFLDSHIGLGAAVT